MPQQNASTRFEYFRKIHQAVETKKHLTNNCFLIAFLLIFVFISQDVTAQTGTATPSPTSTPTAEELELDREIKLLTKRKELENLKKDIRAAQPQPTSTPLSGTATGTGNMFIEVESQTYRSLQRVTNRVACQIKTATNGQNNRIAVLFTPADYAAWRNYKLLAPTLNSQLNAMEAEYNAILDPSSGTRLTASTPTASGLVSAAGLVSATTVALRSFVDLISFLRSDIEFSTKEVTINEGALRASVANALRTPSPVISGEPECNGISNESIPVYDPNIFSPTTEPSGNLSSELTRKLDTIASLRSRADYYIEEYNIAVANLEDRKSALAAAKENLAKINAIIRNNPEVIANLTEQIAKEKDKETKKVLQATLGTARTELATANTQKPGAETAVTAAQAAVTAALITPALKLNVARLKQLNADYDKILADLTRVNSDTGTSPLMYYVRAENLDNVLSMPNTNAYWLKIRAVKGGGNNRVRKNLIRFIFGPDISHSGGSIVEYSLGNKKGEILLSNTDGQYEKYRKASNINVNP